MGPYLTPLLYTQYILKKLNYYYIFAESEYARRRLTGFRSLAGLEEGEIPYHRLGLDKIELAWIQQLDSDEDSYEGENKKIFIFRLFLFIDLLHSFCIRQK